MYIKVKFLSTPDSFFLFVPLCLLPGPQPSLEIVHSALDEHDNQIEVLFEYLKKLGQSKQEEKDFQQRKRIGFKGNSQEIPLMFFWLGLLMLLDRSEPSASTISTFVFFLLSFVFSLLLASFSDLYKNSCRNVLAYPRHTFCHLPFIPDTLQPFRLDLEKDKDIEPDYTLYNRYLLVVSRTDSGNIRLLPADRLAFYGS